MRRAADLRVCDSDREAVAGVLTRHYLVGRLTEEELSARVDAAYRARYESQLVALLRDLPALARGETPPPARSRANARLVAAGVALVGVAIVLGVDADGPLTALVAVVTALVGVLALFAILVAPIVGAVRLAESLSHSRPRQITIPPRPPRRS